MSGRPSLQLCVDIRRGCELAAGQGRRLELCVRALIDTPVRRIPAGASLMPPAGVPRSSTAIVVGFPVPAIVDSRSHAIVVLPAPRLDGCSRMPDSRFPCRRECSTPRQSHGLTRARSSGRQRALLPGSDRDLQGGLEIHVRDLAWIEGQPDRSIRAPVFRRDQLEPVSRDQDAPFPRDPLGDSWPAFSRRRNLSFEAGIGGVRSRVVERAVRLVVSLLRATAR